MNSAQNFNTKRLSWFESGKSLPYIIEQLEKAKQKIRIATGFFSIKGWELVRNYTQNKQTYLLVGLDDPGEERARLALIKEIMQDLRTGLERERRQAVCDLVSKIQSEQFELVDARARDHHNKLYISDETVAIQTSSNLTRKGLTQQVEGGNIIEAKREILALIQEFDYYFSTARDLTQELLSVLLKWLQLAKPWDIYMKTMLALENLQEPKTRYEKKPVSYQVDMITRTLQHLKAFEGSMLVASTGLGKTVVAIHIALHLRDEGLIDNVMVIGPKAVKKNWKEEMRDAGLPCDYFIRQMFDKAHPRQDGNLELFNDILEKIDRRSWLIIIDESHEFRNRFKQDLFNLKKKPEEKRAFKRLRELIKTGNPKVLLLTGSPYATDIENINSQLYLLPHTAQKKPSDLDYFIDNCPEHQYLFEEEIQDSKAWQVETSEHFINLPNVSQLTTPHVAKYYGKDDDKGTYIFFDREKRYIPRVMLHSINFPLILAKEITQAITQDYFKLNSKNAMFKDLFDRLVKVAWSSSPIALKDILEGIVDTPKGKNSYNLKKVEFIMSQQERKYYLNPILDKLEKLSVDDDIKILALFVILEETIKKQQKVIIFAERRATVIYLYREIKVRFPSLNIAVTIEQNEEDSKYKMKKSTEVDHLIKQFSPKANKSNGRYLESYDIFIATDAQGIGVNMQDASIVINYDIAWTPIRPIQRAGRVLRFWDEPRTVQIFTFVPILVNQAQKTSVDFELLDIQKRWNKLMSRHHESKKLIDLPVLTTAKIQEIYLPDMASEATIQSGEMDINAFADLEISPYYQHTAKLQANRDYAETLTDDLMSAKTYPDKNPLLYMLLLYQNEYRCVFYDLRKKQITEPEPVKLLNKIACTEDTPTAHVDYNLVEVLSDRCLKSWCAKNKINPNEVQRICTLYLKPEQEDDNLKTLLLETS